MKLDRKTLLSICVSIFLLFLCIRYWDPLANIFLKCLSAASPLLLGCILAYILNLLMSVYERHYFPKSKKKAVVKSRRPVCLTASILSLLAIVALVIGVVLPQLIECIALLASEIPPSLVGFADWLQKHGLLNEQIFTQLSNMDWGALLGTVGQWLTSGIGSVIDLVITTVSATVSVVITVFVAIIFAIYLLADKERLARQGDRLMRRYLKESVINKFEYLLKILDDCFHRYIVGQCTEAVILGSLCAVGMLILRLPYAAMISALIAFTALIPIAGAYIGATVGAFMILTVSPSKALIFLIFIVVLQQFEGNVIYPRVVGSSLDLPALWVLAAVTVGGGVLGIPGMLLGVPITAAIYRMIRADVDRNTDEAGLPEPEPKPEKDNA